MTANNKQLWVADNLHYPIPLSAVEKRVMSTQVFNRLHNILQNSTVYLTYPSVRTSRFSHSLGCMHIAGLIFRYGVMNATEEDRHRFIDALAEEIRAIQRDDAFLSQVSVHFNESRNGDLKRLESSTLRDPLYSSLLPGSLEDPHRYAYIIALQALRLVALLHDLGHPPFSHVTEFALIQMFESIVELQKTGHQLTARQKHLLDIAEHYYVRSPIMFHEELGRRLARHILDEIVRAVASIDRGKYCFDLLVTRFLAERILTSDDRSSSVVQSLHRIFDNCVDADRLDYVVRDISISGISKEPLRYDRLITSFQLIYHTTKAQQTPLFLPSVRALSTLEDFFQRRLDLYKYITYHHRVAKTDGLLREVVVELGQEWLAEQTALGDNVISQQSQTPSSYLLPNNVSGLWSVLDPSTTMLPKEIIYNYIQWDDAWLLSMLRQHFFNLQLGREATSHQTQRQLVEVRLEEILSNKKEYHSLYKQVDSFSEIDDAFIRSLPAETNLAQMLEAVTSGSETKKAVEKFGLALDKHLTTYRKFASVEDNLTELRESHGFLLAGLAKSLRVRGKVPERIGFVDDAVAALKRKGNLDDVYVVYKPLTPGVTREFHLVADNEVIELGQVSSIAAELERKVQLFPPFYVYVHKSRGVRNDELLEMRRLLGQLLAQSFVDWTTKQGESS